MNRMTTARTYTILFLACNFMAIPCQLVAADGKLLRGERWKPFTAAGHEADFYVAPNGNDTWSGTLAAPDAAGTDGPFATIDRARKAVRERKDRVYLPKEKPVEKRWIGSPHKLGKGRDILVLIRGGYYCLDAPLTFTAMDGGERVETNLPSGAFEYHELRDHYVTYAAYPGETPVISGGRPVANWTRDGDIWSTRLENIDVKMLLANGAKQTLARAPNSGYFVPPAYSRTERELSFRKGELASWPDMAANRVIMLLRWHTGVNSITRVDEAQGIAYLAAPESGIVIVPPRFYVENVRALLDAPGEWFFDRQAGQLSYICPPASAHPNEMRMVVPSLERLVVVQGEAGAPVRNLRFYGLHFEAVNPGGSGVSFEYTHGCELVDSRLTSMGGAGVQLAKGCYQTRILRNFFQAIDAEAIAVSGNPHPEKWLDTIRETIISYNRIDDCGSTNIAAHNALYTTISRNEITDTRGRYAISVGGWSNLEEALDGGYRVEYNHLHRVQQDADDSGAIKTAGLTHDSIVRRNLVHDVKAGYFNDNVGFWFDNMSSDWLTEENIFYNLEQGEMKLCAANLVDNTYRNNFLIEAPAQAPEGILEGEPEFHFDDLKLESHGVPISAAIATGSCVDVTAQVTNTGASGILPVDLYLNGRKIESQLFPVIRNNRRTIRFALRLNKAGEHRIAVGTTPFQSVSVRGEDLAIVYDNLAVTNTIIAAGEQVTVSAVVRNLTDQEQRVEARLFVDGEAAEAKAVQLAAMSDQTVEFAIAPGTGRHTVKIGNSAEKAIAVYACSTVDVTKVGLATHCSDTAKPHQIAIEQDTNQYQIEAGGSDFYHGEDSYAAVFVQQKIKGNFVSTVKVNSFGDRTHEWFRAGLFARNDMAKSFSTEPGSAGSVLMFATPGRVGIQFDEFADGCMHKANSQNLPEDIQFPIWLKLVRHGDRFSGYVSFDGKTWTWDRTTKQIPGLADAIHIGLAAGSCDQKPYRVSFEDFQLRVEDQDAVSSGPVVGAHERGLVDQDGDQNQYAANDVLKVCLDVQEGHPVEDDADEEEPDQGPPDAAAATE